MLEAAHRSAETLSADADLFASGGAAHVRLSSAHYTPALLAVVRSEQTSGVVTEAALGAILKLLQLDFLGEPAPPVPCALSAALLRSISRPPLPTLSLSDLIPSTSFPQTHCAACRRGVPYRTALEDVATARAALVSIVFSATHCRFEAAETPSDENVLMYLLQVRARTRRRTRGEQRAAHCDCEPRGCRISAEHTHARSHAARELGAHHG